MGFFTRLFVGSKEAADEETRLLHGPGTFSIPIVGESHYQPALEAICGGRTPDGADVQVTAVLVLEESNSHDRKAVRVDIRDKTVGYLSGDDARRYRQALAQAGHPRLRGRCQAEIHGGWDRGPSDRGNFGVWLDLPADED